MTRLFSHGQHEDLGSNRIRTTIGLKPINYLSNGIYRPITNRLGNSGDPNLTVGVDELAQFRLRPMLSGNAPVVHFGKGNSHVRFTPLGTANVTGRAFGENGFEYPNAWPNSDLRFIMGGHRLQKDIILRAGHPTSFSFRIDSHAGLDIGRLETPDFCILQPILSPPVGNVVQSIPLTWIVTTLGGKTILTVTLPLGNWSGWTLDPTLTLQPDATDGKDTVINSLLPTQNSGVNVSGNLGHFAADDLSYRELLQFDLTSILTSATVSVSTLTLTRTGNNGTQAYTFGAYKILRAWVEGTGNYTESGDGATWNTYDGVNNWGTAGCDNTATDRSGTAENAHAIDYAADNSWSIPTMTQDWVTTAADNKGLLIATTDAWVAQGYWSCASSDNATAANRPKLVVEYTLPAGGAPILQTRPMTFDWSWWR